MKVFDMVFIGLCKSSTLPLFEKRRDWYLDINKLKALTIGRTYSVREFNGAYSGLYVFEDDNGTTLSLCVEDFMLVGDWITYQRDKKIMALL